tara:strand:- start:25 stop:186 length:162 start_codon:yes stop_codon:yes gene_type:complete
VRSSSTTLLDYLRDICLMGIPVFAQEVAEWSKAHMARPRAFFKARALIFDNIT